MPLTRVELERFTAFSKLELDLSPGINILVGANGTGKTHLLKVCHVACDAYWKKVRFADKLVDVFLPSGRVIGRLVTRQKNSTVARIRVFREQARRVSSSFSKNTTSSESAKTTRHRLWKYDPLQSIYIPVKEMLANAPGFRSLHAARELYFDETYADIIDLAHKPFLRGGLDSDRKRLLATLSDAIEGRVQIKNDEFFLRSRSGNIEFSLLAEGIRKLALLWILIQNGTLRSGAVLLWDEPETNLNPKLFKPLVQILLELQRIGVQVLLATHDYVILKEFDLQARETDLVAYHSFYREAEQIVCHSTEQYLEIAPNAIADTFDDLYDREIERSVAGSAS